MRRVRFVAAAVAIAACSSVLSGSGQLVPPARVPVFTGSEEFAFACHQFEASTELVFRDARGRSGNEYEVSMEGKVRRPAKVDAVCATEELEVVSVLDGDERSLLPLKHRLNSRRSGGQWSTASAQYTSFLGDEAEVKVNSVELASNPYKVHSMTLRGEVVIAQERKSVEVPPRAGESMLDTGEGVKLRVSMLRIDQNKRFTCTVDYERGNATASGIVEAVYVLDKNDEVQGGGRWVNSIDPFSERGQFRVTFPLKRNAQVAKLRCDIVTRYTKLPVEFTVTELFQR